MTSRAEWLNLKADPERHAKERARGRRAWVQRRLEVERPWLTQADVGATKRKSMREAKQAWLARYGLEAGAV